MNRRNLIHKGNESLALSAIWGAAGLVGICPLCILASAAFFINSLKQKIFG